MGVYDISASSTSSSASTLSDRSPINIAPIGFNLGAILQPMGQGSPENGGYGMDFMQRYSGGSAGSLTAASLGASNMLPYLLIGGAALAGLLFFMMR